jgi:dephospho-CoA kinase
MRQDLEPLTRPPLIMARYARRPAGPPRRLGPWKRGPLPVIGLVGGIGAGKSLVAAELAGRGAVVLDADTIGHALLDQTPAREQVVQRFGPEVLIQDESAPPRIDRRALGALVFGHPSELRDLERILHPRMRRTFEKAIARAARKGQAPAVVLDAAILFEAGWDDLCDRVVFVDAPAEQRLARLVAQRGWTAEQLAARERAQLPPDQKRGRADVVLVNDAGPESLRAAIDRAWPELLRPARNPRGDGRRAAGGPPRPRPSRE